MRDFESVHRSGRKGVCFRTRAKFAPRSCVVTKIAEGQLYLDNSKRAIQYPDRLLIIERDPLIELIDDYGKSKKSKSQYE